MNIPDWFIKACAHPNFPGGGDGTLIASFIWPAVAPLQEAILMGPPVRFPNLPEQPTGPDVLDAVAAWMDKIDARDGNPDHQVQEHLRAWAERLRAAVREP